MPGQPVAPVSTTGPAQATSAAPGMTSTADNRMPLTPNNGVNGVPHSSANQPAAGINIAALRAVAAKFGIPENALLQLTPAQLQAFLHNLQIQQQQQQQQQQARMQSMGSSTPQRQGSESLPVAQPRPNKSVAREQSESRSPAPGQTPTSGGSNGALFSPTALHSSQVSPHPLGSPLGSAYLPRVISGTNSMQRKASAASMPVDDMRTTPTPSEISIGRAGTVTDHVYTPEEIAAAHKRSEEFLKKLPEFTSETFVTFLQNFLKENNIQGNFSKPPVFADQTIDLYRFFCEVIRQGGLEQVHTRRIWRQVAKDSGLPDIPTLPPLLSRWYKVWLQPLEQLMVFPPGHPTHTGINANFSLKKRRKLDAFGSPNSTPGPGERPYSANSESSKRAKTQGPSVNGVSPAAGSPAQATPPYAQSLQSPIQHSRPPPLPLGSSALSTSALYSVNGLGSSGSPMAPSLPTNGSTSTPTRINGSGAALSSAHMSPAPTPPTSAPVAASLSSSQDPAVSLVTIAAPTAPVPQLRFFPLERSLDTVGGVDLQACIMFRPQLRLPSVSEYGTLDIRALTLGIDSGIPMEVTNALNTLVTASACPEVVLPLGHCEELVESLFGVLENIWLPECCSQLKQQPDCMPTYSEETSKFGDICVNDPSDGGIIGDDMQDATAVRGMLQGGDALWSFTSDRTLSVMYILQNLSFLPVNQHYLARSQDFARVLQAVVAKCEVAVQGFDQTDKNELKGLASLVVLRALELRKSLIVILSNIADKIDLHSADAGYMRVLLRLICYFADEKQANDVTSEWLSETIGGDNDPAFSVTHAKALDGRAYFLHALEVAGRLTASDRNREALASTMDLDLLLPLIRTCSTLLTGNQAAIAANRSAIHIHASEQRLMWVQLALLAVSNVVSAVTPQPLLASRRYTALRISNTGSIARQADSTSGGTMRRELQRRSMPFLPTVYTTAAIPDSLRRFRRQILDDIELVRALFELMLLWWVHIGHGCSVRGASAGIDSPLNDLAERAVYVLQRLHPEHEAIFASRWSEWVVERVALGSFASVLVEVLYELAGLIPVQTMSSN
ncbi:hypothetical protein IWW42_001693 [Coemansia sp. RSA 1085]|nr:hypothetical protein IWW42_001693 [Coemansia sp. RSA 1085]